MSQILTIESKCRGNKNINESRHFRPIIIKIIHQFSHAKMKKQLKLMIAGIKIKNFLAPILNLNNKQHSSREK